MCGVTGIWARASVPFDDVLASVGRMTDVLAHRGPDDGGCWGDAAAGIALGHRRLSIVDLSAAGHQPMISTGGRYVVSYNGEIYNHARLRKELVRSSFRGHSDTEVLLAAVEEWGLEAAVSRFVGMFAFALWDRETRTLSLVRDRFGIKPLYFAELPTGLAIASDANALRQLPTFDDALDPAALTEYLRYAYVPSPSSIYRTARKVLPGTIVRFSQPDARRAISQPYYDARAIALGAADIGFSGSVEDAADALEAALGEAIADRLLADVPVGAFLSGGVDSSTVVALAQARAGRTLKTFCVGSETSAYDESRAAAAVAAHLGTDHTTLVATPEEALSALTELPGIHDEPFADTSQIPTFLVSRLARREVIVALSGDGGDEVFGGYNRHVYAPVLYRRLRRVPRWVRALAGHGLTAVSPAGWDAAHRTARRSGWMSKVVPDVAVPGQKMHKLGAALPARSLGDLYVSLCSQWQNPELLAPGTGDAARARAAALEGLRARVGDAGAIMLTDLLTYLPDDILTKVDRASMAVSLEARVPLLDHRVVELAWSFPESFKVQGRLSKRLLRRVLARHVPERLFDRPKMGFGIPIGDWMRGPLRDWCEDLLSPQRLAQTGSLAAGPVRAAWQEHLSGRADRANALWTVLAFQAWRTRSSG